MKDQYKPKLKISHKIKFKQRLLKKRLAILAAVTIVALWAANFMTSKDTLAFEDGTEMGEITVTSVCSHTPSIQRRWLIHNPNDFDIPIEWKITPNFQSGLMILKPGDNYLMTNTIRGYNPIQVKWQDQNGEWIQTVKTSDGEACPISGCFVSEVVDYKPTKRNDGSIIPISSRDPQKAIGPMDEQNPQFVTLGFGGEITMKFPQAIANGEGNDIKLFENTPANLPCARYPERIMAFASQDGCNYVYLGEGCQDAEFDLGTLSWAQYVKLIDISPLNAPYNNAVADGYDLEGIACLNGTIENPVFDNLTPGSPQKIVNYKPGRRKNGTPVHSSRANANLAIGVPSMDDLAINFVALGFNGSIILKFDFAVFNKEGNDLMVIETSFGAPDCQSYSEEAYFEGSLDGINWTPLGTVCLDGSLDLGSMIALQYIRVTDRSPMSLFNNTADGYDLDGIMVLNHNCGESSQRRTFHDRNDIPDEINDAKVFPNPFTDSFELEIESSGVNEKLTFKLYNYVGQEVLNKQYDVPAGSVFRQQIDASHLKKGAYVGSIDFMGDRQSVKLIKN
jgi:hypothetical protein